MENYYEIVKKRILNQINSDEYQLAFQGTEQGLVDKNHFLEVVQLTTEMWESNEKLKIPVALKIAALCHDSDRIYPKRQINTKNVPKTQYEYRKGVHSGNTSLLFFENNLDLPRELVRDVCNLILRHEHGGDRSAEGELFESKDEFTKTYNLNHAADYLYYADKLSFFYSNIKEYSKRGKERLLAKIEYSLKELPLHIVKKIKKIKYDNPLINECINQVLNRLDISDS